MSAPDDIRDQLVALNSRFEEHVEKEERMWHEAFPNGDMTGHRLAHEQMIVAAKEQARFWSELRLDLAKKSIWVLLAVLVTLVAAGGWTWVLAKLAGAPVVLGEP